MRLLEDFRPLSPPLGLAIDEVVWASSRRSKRLCVRFWVNQASIIIGRSQRLADEVDTEAAARHGVSAFRRISGGGAVVHYPGNLNVSICLPDAGRFGGGVEAVFDRLGKEVALGLGRTIPGISARGNGLYAKGKKVGGAAQARRGSSGLYHTTILIGPLTVPMTKLLRAHHPGYAPATVASRPRPVVTMSDLAQRVPSLAEVASGIEAQLTESWGEPFQRENLSESELEAAIDLAATKYGSPQWNASR